MKNGCAFGFLCAKFGKPTPCAHEDQYDRDDRSTWPDWMLRPFTPEGGGR